MYQLIESIRIENKTPHLVEYHNRRFNEACKTLFGIDGQFDLNHYIHLPHGISRGRYKYRILFDGLNFQTEIQRYEQRKINSLQVVRLNQIDYAYKTTNRQKLEEAFKLRGGCDDVVIVKNGMITDAFVSNILLFDGRQWITPSTPLLKGTQRAYLLDQKKIFEKKVPLDEIHEYTHIKLINAMIPEERADVIDVQENLCGL